MDGTAILAIAAETAAGIALGVTVGYLVIVKAMAVLG